MTKKHFLSVKIRILFIVIVVISSLISICTCFQADYSKALLDTVLNMEGTGDIIRKLIVAILVLLIGELLRKILTIEYERYVTNSLQTEMMSGFLSMNFKEFREKNQDAYISIFNNEMKDVISEYYITMLDFIFSIISVLFYSIFLIQLQPIMAIIVVVSNILPIIVPALFVKSLQFRKNEYLQKTQEFNTKLGDAIKGFELISLHNRKELYLKTYESAGNEKTKKKAEYQKCNALCEIAIGFFAYASSICIIVGGVALIASGNLTAGGLLAAITVSEAMVAPITNLTYQANAINAIRPTKNAILEKYVHTETTPKGYLLDKEIEKIEIKNLSFAYEGKRIFHNANAVFEKNKKYLVCGENGSGKSTLIKILSKQCEYDGSILVNGIELREINTESYFEKIGLASQKAFIFNDSLENNITLFEVGDKERMKAILCECQADKLVEKMESEMIYHDGKCNLSGGEAQKIALSRLFFDNKHFQIWDEAMSAFDNSSNEALESAILQKPEITLIHISHRINTDVLAMYDEIYELVNGKLEKK